MRGYSVSPLCFKRDNSSKARRVHTSNVDAVLVPVGSEFHLNQIRDRDHHDRLTGNELPFGID